MQPITSSARLTQLSLLVDGDAHRPGSESFHMIPKPNKTKIDCHLTWIFLVSANHYNHGC